MKKIVWEKKTHKVTSLYKSKMESDELKSKTDIVHIDRMTDHAKDGSRWTGKQVNTLGSLKLSSEDCLKTGLHALYDNLQRGDDLPLPWAFASCICNNLWCDRNH